jgi:hypothetical protein
MALARVVTFDAVDRDRMQEMVGRMNDGDKPEGMPPAEIVVMHDPQAEKSMVVLFLDSEDDYNRADEILQAMPTDDTPGQRSSVTKYDVAFRMNG